MKKESALRIMLECAKSYNENFVDNNLLFISSDKHKNITFFETVFYSSNFLHLTGVKLSKKYINKISSNGKGLANSFFNDCVENKLTLSDFDFDDYGQAELKLQVLPSATSKNASAKMYGEYDGLIVHDLLCTEKVIGNNNLCLGFIKKDNSNFYIPNTLLKKDIRDFVGSYKRIILIYKKNVKEKYYSEKIYTAKNININDFLLPDKYKYLMK